MNSIDIFPWDDNFSTGLPEVDEQHRKLVQMLNLLASNIACGANHHVIHQSFVQEVVRLKASLESLSLPEVAEKTLGFLARWLASHILESDCYLACVVHAHKEPFIAISLQG